MVENVLDDKIKTPMKIYEDIFHVATNYVEYDLDIYVVEDVFVDDKIDSFLFSVSY